MAQICELRLLDDLSGDPAVVTVRFSIDGTDYEIDLTHPNARTLREVFTPYIKAGRRRHKSQQNARRPTPWVSKREENGQIREWAARQGIRVLPAGRISNYVLNAYRQAN